MSRSYNFRTLDVFTDKPYAGNQLGIVTIPASQPLTQFEKQSIATEFNYSETIFVHDPDPNPTSTSTSISNSNDDESDTASSPPPPHVTVDIFTPESELPFAGHPTIGAVNHILTHVYPDHDTVVIDLKAGPVIGTLDRATGQSRAEIPQAFHRHAKPVEWERDVLRSQAELGVDGDDEASGMQGSRHVLVSIVRGMSFALVDLSAAGGAGGAGGGQELLSRVRVTSENVAGTEHLDDGWPGTLMGSLFYSRKPDEGDGVVRVDQRVIVIGLEDPATGSASCALTAHLALELGGKGAVHRFELVQGEQMGRRSVIGAEVTLDESGAKIEKILLMGQCKAVMKGELEI